MPVTVEQQTETLTLLKGLTICGQAFFFFMKRNAYGMELRNGRAVKKTLKGWRKMYYTKNDFIDTAGQEELECIAQARKLTRMYYETDYKDTEKRHSILNRLFGSIGEDVAIDTPFHCNYGKNIFIGSHVIININCTFVDDKEIRIGDYVLIASNVQIYTASHPVLPQERLDFDAAHRQVPFFRTFALPVEIQNNVWIGGGSIILPGVTIGENSVIGAGSIVTRSVPPNCVAFGNPCRVMRQL